MMRFDIGYNFLEKNPEGIFCFLEKLFLGFVLNRKQIPQRDHVQPVALVAAAASEQVGIRGVAVPLFDLSTDAALECRFLWIHHTVSFLLFIGSSSNSFLMRITVLIPFSVSFAVTRTG